MVARRISRRSARSCKRIAVKRPELMTPWRAHSVSIRKRQLTFWICTEVQARSLCRSPRKAQTSSSSNHFRLPSIARVRQQKNQNVKLRATASDVARALARFESVKIGISTRSSRTLRDAE